jgi:hypothetical protein
LQLKDPEGDGPSARHAALRSRVLLETEAAAPYLDSTKILFWHEGNTFGAYQYATWAEPPSDVFGRALLEKISRDGVVADVSEKAGLIAAIGERYRSGCRAVRGRILDEFAAITGLHRKHAARLLRATHIVDRSKARPDRRVYNEAVDAALLVLWEASDRICSKRLRVMLPVLVEA